MFGSKAAKIEELETALTEKNDRLVGVQEFLGTLSAQLDLQEGENILVAIQNLQESIHLANTVITTQTKDINDLSDKHESGITLLSGAAILVEKMTEFLEKASKPAPKKASKKTAKKRSK